MTDRYEGFFVALDKSAREDDAAPIVSALAQIKGVVRVEPVVSGIEHQIARMQVDHEWVHALVEFIEAQRRRNS